MCLYLDERRGVQENTSMRSRELPRPNTGVSLYARLESRYKHYPIYKCYEGLDRDIVRAMNKAIAMSKPRAKKKPYLIVSFLGMAEQ